MGGGGQTQKDVDSPTELLNSAKKQLEARGRIINDNVSWVEATKLLAELCFADDYPYAFDIRNPQPPGAAPNTDAIGLSDFCSVNIDQSGYNSKISQYIDQVFLKAANVPVKMKAEVGNDLSQVAQDCVARAGTAVNEWYEGRYMRTFEHDRSDDAISGNNTAVKVDAVYLYCNTKVKNGGKTEQLLVFYYMAVYYWVTSESQKKRDGFKNQAFTNAQQLTGITWPIRDESDLREALKDYCKEQFKDHFKYDYDNGPPNAIVKKPQDPLWRTCDLPYSKQRKWVEDLVTSYCQNFGSKDLEESVNKSLNSQLGTVASGTPASANGNWIEKPLLFTHNPTPDQRSTNTVVFNGYLYYFTNFATTGQDYDVALTYVFIMGYYYETRALGQIVAGDLYSQLIHSLPDANQFAHLFSHSNLKEESTLQKFALMNAKIYFKNKFYFDWSQGTSARTRDRHEKILGGYERFMDLGNFNSVDTNDVEDQVSRIIQRDHKFRDVDVVATESLYDDLVDTIKGYGKVTSDSTRENQWVEDYIDKDYYDEKCHNLHEYAVLLYVYGTRSDGDTDTRQFFVQYLGVITSRDA
jgi:hypothetical protein